MRCAYLPKTGSRCDGESTVVHLDEGPFCDRHMFVCILADNINMGTMTTLSKVLKLPGDYHTVSLEYVRLMADKHADFIERELGKRIAGREYSDDDNYSDVADII